jgi:hypothetical protein
LSPLVVGATSAALVAGGCTADPKSTVDAGSAGDDGGDFASAAGDEVIHTYAPTFAAIYDEILQPTCALPFCHAGTGDYLELFSRQGSYAALVGVPAQGPCASTGLLRVAPGHPASSILYLKVTNPPCGAKMPMLYGNAGTLDAREVAQIEEWIARGALDD